MCLKFLFSRQSLHFEHSKLIAKRKTVMAKATAHSAEFRSKIFTYFILFIIIGLTSFSWIVNFVLQSTRTYPDYYPPISPMRWLFSIFAPLIITIHGLQKRSLDKSGAFAGFIVGFILTLANYCFFASLLTFFVVGSKATKYKAHLKRKQEDDYKEGGQRNWMQVISNGGVAAIFAAIFIIEAGCGEFLLDFRKNYAYTWCGLAVLGAVSACCGDTLSSEVGSVAGGTPRLITGLGTVPRGTNGGVTVVGVLASGVGGLLVGAAYFLPLVAFNPSEFVRRSPAQWVVVPTAALAGLIGSLVDSVLGATLQYSGYDRRRGVVVNHPGDGIEHISGAFLLDNHGVNLLTSIIMGFVTPSIGFSLYSYYT